MLRRDKALLGITIGVALLDLGLLCSTYAKKRGIAIRDMVLKTIEDATRGRDKDAEKFDIPIE